MAKLTRDGKNMVPATGAGTRALDQGFSATPAGLGPLRVTSMQHLLYLPLILMYFVRFEHCRVYNIVSANRFYRDYSISGESVLDNFYRTYQPIITDEHYTCVGLGFELLRRLTDLDERYPGLAKSLYLTSCEETIGNVASYVGGPPAPASGEKEHVLVCLRIKIGERCGFMLLDPGYHIARVVTVMADKLYPHTGWFTQIEEPNCTKLYNYYPCTEDPDYIEWHERVTRPGAFETAQVALIYVARPYLTAIDVTERRNLVYNHKSLIARDTKGHTIAGIYFPVVLDRDNATFTIFHQTANRKKRVKMAFNKFQRTSEIRPNAEEMEIVAECARQLEIPPDELESIISALARIMSDTSFVTQLLTINQHINTLAEAN
ncbi:hypothetical protein EAI_16481 [Harpegnathos saltator]|uniref:Uncharacterized protein n=1 Tax=Harpegnathos saltator TaxID=610380 RepID=E2C5A2_HARSA|nr:hypothetical protein EAI_16481 [Harpegnathos saltator]